MTFNFVPNLCPVCHSSLEWRSHDLYCLNKDCPAKESSSLYHWLCSMGRRDILGIGDSLLESIIGYYGWTSVYDIYDSLPAEGSWTGMLDTEGIGESKLELVRQVIANLTETPVSFGDFLASLSIKGISYKTAHTLETSTNLRECLEKDTRQNLNVTQAKGLGDSVLNTLLDSWVHIRNMYLYVKDMLMDTPKEPPAGSQEPSNRLKVCITGKANDGLTRSQFYQKYSDSIEESSVSSCDYLVCNQLSNSSKIRTAKAKGIKVITEAELAEILKG